MCLLVFNSRLSPTRKTKTDGPETDGAKTDDPETEIANTEEDRHGGRGDGRYVSLFFLPLFYLKIVEGFSWCDCLISFEWRVYVVQPYVSLGDNSNSVCGCWWVIGWGCMGACRGGDSRKSRFSRGMYI